MKDRIKRVIRIDLPETNSSSSHSVAICMTNKLSLHKGDPGFDLDIRDGILYLPEHPSFGWEYFKSNSIEEKLLYVCGIFCSDIETASGQKRIYKLKRFLKDTLGVKDVKFAWIDKYFKEEMQKDPDDRYYEYPSIDHESHDIFDEITENTDTLKNFIFNEGSWLYGGNDNSDSPVDFKKETQILKSDVPDAIVSVHFPEPIGRVDFEVDEFPSNISLLASMTNSEDIDILKYISYDSDKKSVQFEHDYCFSRRKNILTIYSNGLVFKDSKCYVVYISEKFNDLLLDDKNFTDCYRVRIQKAIDKGLVEEGIDYVLFPISVKYNKLNITL
jgi:hypothetical protein